VNDALKVLNEFQNLMRNFEWFQRVSGYGSFLFLGAFITLVANRFLLHDSDIASIVYYIFLFSIIILIGNASYNLLSQGLVAWGIYTLVFNVYQVLPGYPKGGLFSSYALIMAILYLAAGYMFFKLRTYGTDYADKNSLKCASCSTVNPNQSKYCGGCGKTM